MSVQHRKDPPVPLREQGVDLDDEAVLGPYDLAGIKAAVDARTGGGGPGGGGGWGAGALAAAAVLLAGMGLGTWLLQPPDLSPSSPTAFVSTAPEQAPPAAEAPVPTSRGSSPPSTEPLPAVALATRATAPAPAPSTASGAEPPAHPHPPALPDPADPPPAQVAPAGTAEAPASGDLDAQNAVFGRGETALRDRDWVGAGEAFHEYLQRWPEGIFRDDALIAVLDLLIRAGSWSEVEALAAQLAAIPSLASRRPQLIHARAEALVHLGNCPEALALAESLDRAASVSIRKSCR